jgi:excisionase family DNA binding protein
MIDIASEVSAALQPVLVELRELRATVEALRPPRYGTIADAARILACSDQTVRARIADHRVVATQIGRAWRVDLASLRPTDPAEIATLARTARGQT